MGEIEVYTGCFDGCPEIVVDDMLGHIGDEAAALAAMSKRFATAYCSAGYVPVEGWQAAPECSVNCLRVAADYTSRQGPYKRPIDVRQRTVLGRVGLGPDLLAQDAVDEDGFLVHRVVPSSATFTINTSGEVTDQGDPVAPSKAPSNATFTVDTKGVVTELPWRKTPPNG